MKIAVRIFVNEQGTAPKDSNNFAEKRVRTSDPLDIQYLAPSPADKDLQIAVRAFFKMRFSYHRLFTSILAWLLSASFQQGAVYRIQSVQKRVAE
jgi:hypothetical protein